MSEPDLDSNLQPKSETESPPTDIAASPCDLEAVKAARRRQLLAGVLADADPRAAVLATAGVEALELGGLLKPAIAEVAAATGDPVERLAKLQSAMRTHADLTKLAGKLL